MTEDYEEDYEYYYGDDSLACGCCSCCGCMCWDYENDDSPEEEPTDDE